MENVGKPVESLCIMWKNGASQKRKNPKVIHRKGRITFGRIFTETSDDVEYFVDKTVDNVGIVVDNLWENVENRPPKTVHRFSFGENIASAQSRIIVNWKK